MGIKCILCVDLENLIPIGTSEMPCGGTSGPPSIYLGPDPVPLQSGQSKKKIMCKISGKSTPLPPLTEESPYAHDYCMDKDGICMVSKNNWSYIRLGLY